jgi:hypothetical protein
MATATRQHSLKKILHNYSGRTKYSARTKYSGRHSTYVIIPKRPKFRKKFFGKIKKEEFARRFFKKNSVFSRLKWLNKPFSKMTSFFNSVLPVVYCGGGEISPRVKPNSRSWLEGQPILPFPWGVKGKNF